MNYSRYPAMVIWNFGYQCNMNCLHCYSRSLLGEREKMSKRNAEIISDKIICAGAMHVHFGGGEPLMRDDFFVIARKFHKAKLTMSLSSNGFFVDADMANRLSGLINMVGLSIYGSNQKSHEGFTRFPGSFAKLIEAQRLLQANGVANKFVVVLCAKTAPETVNIIQLAHDLGVVGIQFYTMKTVGNAGSDPKLQLTPQ